MPLEVFGVDIACAPIGKLHLLPYSSEYLLSLLHKFLHLLFVLQLDELLPSARLFRSSLHCLGFYFFLGRRVVELREREPDEVEIELEFSEEGGFVGLAELLVLVDHSRDLIVEEGLFVERCLGHCFLDYG